jgi:plastocyanin
MPNKKRFAVATLVAALSVAVVTVALLGTGAASAAPTAAAKKCLHPKKSTVTVKEFEYGFTLSPKTPVCGTITFKQTNTGSLSHNFDITGVKAGKLLNSHTSAKFTVTMKPGKYPYLCDVLGHASLGMVGTLTVKD